MLKRKVEEAMMKRKVEEAMMKQKADDLAGWGGASAASRFGDGNGFRPRKMCSFYMSGRCSRGDTCTYAHSLDELDPQAAMAVYAEAAAEAAAMQQPQQDELEQALAETAEVSAQQAEDLHGAEEASAAFAPSVLQGPREFPPNQTPQQLCPFWMHHPACCEQSDSCSMAHGLAELGLEFGDPVEIRTDGAPPEQQHRASGSAGASGGGANGRIVPPIKRTPGWKSSGIPAGIAPMLALNKGEDHSSMGKGGWGPKTDSMQQQQWRSTPYAEVDRITPAATGMGGASYMPGHMPNRFAGSNFMPMKICQYWMQDPNSCTRGMGCSFAHGVHELQPNAVATCGISRFHHGRPPTKFCTFYANGQCTKGVSCTFAHSPEELQG